MNVNILKQTLQDNLSNPGITSNGSHFFIFGGTNDSWMGKDAIYIVDSQTLTCTKTESQLPIPSYGMGIAKIENNVYLFGGVHVGEVSTAILCFNLETLQFININSSLPIGIENPRVIPINAKIYIFGGNNPVEQVISQIYEYDPEIDRLTTLTVTLPQYLVGFMMHWTGTEILLMGGLYTNNLAFTNEIWQFDPKMKILEKKEQSLPTAFRGAKYLSFGEYIYIFDVFNATGHYSTLFEINTQNFVLARKKEDFLQPDRCDYAIINDDFYTYLFGGNIYPSIYPGNSIIRIDIDSANIVSKESFDSSGWVVSDTSLFNFDLNKKHLSWKTNNSPQNTTKQFQRITKIKDALELEITYLHHA
ncbi:MAG: hypothetical protein ACFFDT_17330, partial [Candidatus Hodarchaeota archaeon]